MTVIPLYTLNWHNILTNWSQYPPDGAVRRCSGQFPCSNLGTLFEPDPLVKVVLPWQLLMKLWALVWTSSAPQSWKAVYLQKVLRLPVWHAQTIMMLRSLNSEDSWRLQRKKLENNNFGSWYSALEMGGKCFPCHRLAARWDQRAVRRTDSSPTFQISTISRCLAGRKTLNKNSRHLQIFTWQFVFHHVASPYHLENR